MDINSLSYKNRLKINKKRYEKLISNGLCTRCGKEPSLGFKICINCRNKRNELKKFKKNELKKLGICTGCGQEPVLAGDKSIYSWSCKKTQSCLTCCLKYTSRRVLGSKNRWQELLDLFKKQNGICPYLGWTLIIGENANLDHILPLTRGGTNNIENLQWVSDVVNRMKCNLLPDEFLDRIKDICTYRNL